MCTKISGFFILSLLIIVSACSASKPVSTNDAEDETTTTSVFPEWYNGAETVSDDSLYFYGFATAVGSDSSTAIERAELQAGIELDRMLSSEFENIRKQLVQQGKSGAEESEFLLLLRNTATPAMDEAKTEKSSSVKTGNSYRAFVMIRLPKSKIADAAEKYFRSYPQYWSVLSESAAYRNFIK